MEYFNFSLFDGMTFKSVKGMENGNDEVIFETECGRTFRMYHQQDCCERVYLEDVVGDVDDLIGSPILYAEESTSETPPDEENREYWDDLQRWTFYKLATIKGYVDLRWFGSSNGYYGVSVDVVEL